MSHLFSGKLLALSAAVLLSAPFISSQAAFANQNPDYQAVSCLPTHITSGYLQENIKVTYTADDTVRIEHAALECDVQLNLSTYVMPANFNGGSFFDNPTAYPQPLFANVSQQITGGHEGNFELTVDLPNVCNNVQIDAYFGDVITTVGPAGHSTYNLLSQVYLSEGACPAPVQAPAAGIGGDAPAAPVKPLATNSPAQLTAPATPVAQLANTGASQVVAFSLATAITGLTLLGTRYVRNFKI